MSEVRLDTQEWNQLLAVLAQAPWNVANPLIMKIGEQLRAQAGGLASDAANQAGAARGNSDGREKTEH